MEMTKLKKKRLEKRLTQQQIADYLSTDKSNYCRKEQGNIKITTMEWEKLSKILQCELEDIYENEDKNILINSQNAIGNNNVYNPINDITLKYIAKLEEEIVLLKEEIKKTNAT